MFAGVLETRHGNFEAQISCNGRTHRLGTFANAEAAACAYDDAVRAGGGSLVNFVVSAGERKATPGLSLKVTLKKATPAPELAAPEAPPVAAGRGAAHADDGAIVEADDGALLYWSATSTAHHPVPPVQGVVSCGGGSGHDPAVLARMSFTALRKLFKEEFGKPPTSKDSAWLRRKLAKPAAEVEEGRVIHSDVPLPKRRCMSRQEAPPTAPSVPVPSFCLTAVSDGAEYQALLAAFPGTAFGQLVGLRSEHGSLAAVREVLMGERPNTPIPQHLPQLSPGYAALFRSMMTASSDSAEAAMEIGADG